MVSEKTLSVFPGSYLPFVSEERKKRILKYHRSNDRTLSLLGALLVRFLAERHTGISGDDLRFSVLSSGKPILINDIPFYFNLSHCHGFLYVACSDSSPVGADAEEMEDDFHDLLSFFHPAEQQWILEGASEEEQTFRFYTIWTRKEAYIKRSGEGLRRDLSTFNTTDPNLLSELKSRCFTEPGSDFPSELLSAGGKRNKIMTSLCADESLLKIQTEIFLTEEELLKHFTS